MIGEKLNAKQSAQRPNHTHGSKCVNTCNGKTIGQLVQLGYDVTAFTPAAYQRPRLGRPSGRSHLAAGFVLRCIQRLSDPDMATRRCSWRNSRQTRGRSNTVLSY